MEQLKQLKQMRDDAGTRLDAARAAINVSPDAKLFNSLSSLIADLEDSLGSVAGIAPAKEKKAKTFVEPEPVMDATVAVEESVEETKPSEMSLEESLEAELLSDANDLPNGKAASSY